MKESSAVISLGSNINARRNFESALQLLAGYFKVGTVSSFVTTRPIGITDQPDFLNGAVHKPSQSESLQEACFRDSRPEN
jgi:2-amino-4-hydroxy-6-hydroxymethyldihydropteridine diphosphokinase